jgi:polysaccharide export outer membrane protein
MNKVYKKSKLLLGLMAIGVVVFSSCGSTQNAVYFANVDTARFTQVIKADYKEPLIQTDDILTISVQSLGQDAFAAPGAVAVGGGAGAAVASGGTAVSGFLVNKAGNVELPMLGVVKLAGFTTSEAIEVIRTKATQYYKDPTVQVRFANYKITVLGEVIKPATYTVPSEKVTVLDAISMAGDLTVYGKRDNIMLMRDNGDKKDIVRLDLNSTNLISSPYFYLKQNDVLYVEPTKAKSAANNAPRTRLITIGIAAATLIVTILTKF